MSNKLLALVSGWLLAIIVAPATQAEEERLFTYEAKSYSEESLICQGTADGLAERLREELGVTVVEATCVSNPNESFDLRLDYFAEQRLSLISTASPAGSSLDHAGRFEEREQCDEALIADATLFAEQTGLTPDVSYCYRDRISTGDLWLTKIEAFGEATVVPQHGTAFIFSKVMGYSRSTFTAAVRQGAEDLGVAVQDVLIRPSMGYFKLSLLFYGEGRQRIENKEIVRMEKEDQCNEQLAETRTMLEETSMIISFCTFSRIGGYFEINTVGLNHLPSDRYLPAVTYESYEECRADRAAIAERYRDRLPNPILGVLCGIDENQYKPHILMDND